VQREQLTDAQSWIIVCADSALSDEQLADALGVRVSTVHAARWRFRRRGWTCAVRYTTCLHCGEAFTRRGRRDSRREYHDGCKPEARRGIQSAIDRRRWEKMTPEARNVILDRAHEHEAEHQVASQKRAVQHMSRWTADEDAALSERAGEPVHLLARDLGRTLYAVRARVRTLRERGLLDKG
jgi:biotin operon repressor